MFEELVVLAIGKLSNATEFDEAYKAFQEAAEALEHMTVGKFESLTWDRINKMRADMNDARVQAQGGI